MNITPVGDVCRGLVGALCGLKSMRIYFKDNPHPDGFQIALEAAIACAIGIVVVSILDLACRYRRKYPQV